jgi:hypothetical protein
MRPTVSGCRRADIDAMSNTNISRVDAIDQLRSEFLKLTDEDHSICRVAAERGIFCGGFRSLNEQELRNRYWWVVRRRPSITRTELEAIANDWQLTQQEVKDKPLACDVQAGVHDTCRGWEDFSNDELAAFYQQVIGKAVSIQ